MKKIGLFFGTFNPIHVGHLIIGNYFVENTALDEVWFVVTPHNPHKKKTNLLNDHQRLTMVRIAVEEYSSLKASHIEFDLPQPNYTVNTLIYLEEKYPDYLFSLIMGEDNLKHFHKWKNYEVILDHHLIYVYPRIASGDIPEQFKEHNKIIRVDAPIIELSSTAIRKSVQKGENVKPLLPFKVWKYLDEMNFYKEKTAQ